MTTYRLFSEAKLVNETKMVFKIIGKYWIRRNSRFSSLDSSYIVNMNRKRQTRKGEEARSHFPSLRANASSLIIQIKWFSDLVLTCREARDGSGPGTFSYGCARPPWTSYLPEPFWRSIKGQIPQLHFRFKKPWPQEEKKKRNSRSRPRFQKVQNLISFRHT